MMDYDEMEVEKIKGEERKRAFISKRRDEEGAPDDYEYSGILDRFIKMNSDRTDFTIWGEECNNEI